MANGRENGATWAGEDDVEGPKTAAKARVRGERPPPDNAWAFAWRFVEKFGIIGAVCILLVVSNYFTIKWSREDAKGAHDEFAKKMDDQTAAMNSIAANGVQTNMALMKLNDALAEHLREDHHR